MRTHAKSLIILSSLLFEALALHHIFTYYCIVNFIYLITFHVSFDTELKWRIYHV